MNLLICLIIGVVLASPPPGTLEIAQNTISLPGFDCGNGETANGDVIVYYPTELKGPYPIVSFLHGSGGGRFENLCYNIASLGMVVLAPTRGVCGDLSLQQIWAVKGSQLHKDFHPALSHVNYESVGAIGHSMGGAFTMGTASMAREHGIALKAYVASHGGSGNAAPKIPADIPGLFTTGSRDPRRRFLYAAYNAAPSRPKIFANLLGGMHMSPLHSGQLNEFCAHFLACHLDSRNDSCDLIYGESDESLCHKNPMSSCNIVKDTPSLYVPMLGSTPPGNFQIGQSTISLPGFDCGNGQTQNGNVYVYYPTELKGKYPIISFLHGSGGGRFDNLCYNIASLGMVVVAVSRGVCGGLSDQQMWAVKGARAHQDLHPAFSQVNYESVGAIGHSMGGAWTMNTASIAKDNGFPLKAFVASHGGSSPAATGIPKDLPGLFTTGSADPRRRRLYWAYDATPSRPKIYASLAGGRHMSPLYNGPLNEFCAHFLACHVMPRSESCDLIYGDSDQSLCHKNEMSVCDIVKDPAEENIVEDPGSVETPKDAKDPARDAAEGSVETSKDVKDPAKPPKSRLFALDNNKNVA